MNELFAMGFEHDETAAPNTKAKAVTVSDHAPEALTPLAMLNRAVERGMDPATIEKLIELQERWERNQGRKAFGQALAAAKAEIPVIIKDREVDFTSTKGRTNYRYEDLASIAKVVDPILSKFGLAYRFETTSEANAPISVTCILFHADGHETRNTLSAGRDDSGNKNSQQAIGSTITYLQRYSLKAALGLSAGHDDDGKAGGVGGARISDEQVEELRELIMDVNADLPKLLKYLRVPRLEDINADKFGYVKGVIEQKRGKS